MKRFFRAIVCTAIMMCLMAGFGLSAQARSPYIRMNAKATAYVGRSMALKVKVYPEDMALSWRSDNEAIARVEEGVVTGISAGSARITAFTEDGLEKSCTVTVLPVPAKRFYLDGTESSGLEAFTTQTKASLYSSHTLALSPIDIEPMDASGEFTYKSSKPAVASVSEEGVILGNKGGKTQITVKDKYSKTARRFTLTVMPNEYSVTKKNFLKAVRQIYGRPAPGGGVVNLSGRVYLEGEDLMVTLYLYNGDVQPLNGYRQTMRLYVALDASLGMENFWYAGTHQVETDEVIKSGGVGTATLNLGPVQDVFTLPADKVLLIFSMAFGQDADQAPKALHPFEGQGALIKTLLPEN